MSLRCFTATLLLLASFAAQAEPAVSRLTNSDYPASPDAVFTPGDLCEEREADERRYGEEIPYCERSVSSDRKYAIIDLYDRERDFKIMRLGRNNFKIDHYIPLCMGGSNDDGNLWPQHKDIYELTDTLEFELCEGMKANWLSQARAVEIVRYAKAFPEYAPHFLECRREYANGDLPEWPSDDGRGGPDLRAGCPRPSRR
jgi:hypothetical protein